MNRIEVLICTIFLLSLPLFSHASDSSSIDSYTEQYLELSRSHFEKGDWDEAIRYAEKAIKLDDQNAMCHLWLGHAYGEKAGVASFYRKKHYASLCKSEYERAVALEPDNLVMRWALMVFFMKAPGMAGGSLDEAQNQIAEIMRINPMRGHFAQSTLHIHKKEWKKGENQILAGIKLAPDSTEGYHRLASYYRNREEYLDTAVVTARLSEIHPRDTSARIQLGLLYQQIGRYDEAGIIFESILETDSTQGDALYQLGRIAALTGRNLEAGLACFHKFLEETTNSNFPDFAVYWRMGQIHERLNDSTGATAAYEKSLDLNPDFDEAKAALAKLRK